MINITLELDWVLKYRLAILRQLHSTNKYDQSRYFAYVYII